MAVGDALAFFALDTEVAGRPRLDQHGVEIGDAALGQRLDHARVGLGDLVAGVELIGGNARLNTRDMLPRQQLLLIQIDPAAEGAVARPLITADVGTPGRDGAAVVEGSALSAAGFIQRDGLEERIGVQTSLSPDAGGGGGDFFGEERFQRMGRHSVSARCGVRTDRPPRSPEPALGSRDELAQAHAMREVPVLA